MHPLEIFMQRLPTQVALTQTPDGKHLLRGLPVLRVGTWNGKPYSAADLQEMAANFAEIARSENWQPPLRPYHQRDPEGKPVKLDARDTQGWFAALQYDATEQLLKADVEIVDAATIEALQAGKLRHISSEVFRSGYPAPASGREFQTPVLVGASFVDDPAVKGMPWQLVVNAMEYGHPLAERKEHGRMKFIEALKSLLRKEGVAEDELAQVDQLAQAAPPAPDPKGGDDKPPTDPALLRQFEQLQKANEEQGKQIEQLRAQQAAERAAATVDGYVTKGLLPPAVRVQALALVETLAAVTAPIETLACDAEGKQTGTRKVTALELLGEVLTACKPELLTEPKGRLWQGQVDKAQLDELSDEEVEKAAERLVGGGK